MQRLFERIADHFDGKVEAEEIRPEYARLLFKWDDGGDARGERVEIFPYECRSPEGTAVPLVRVGHPDDGEPVLVTPVPSAIIAVALR